MHADVDSNGRISVMEMDVRTANGVAAALCRRMAVYSLAFTQLQEALKDPNVDLRKYDSLQAELERLEAEYHLIFPVERALMEALSITGVPMDCGIYPPTAKSHE